MYRRQSRPKSAQETNDQELREHERITDIDITEPTLTWLQCSQPHQPISVRDDDRVLNSRFNPQLDCWEILLLVLPHEEREADE